jgi:hypothetical protein
VKVELSGIDCHVGSKLRRQKPFNLKIICSLGFTGMVLHAMCNFNLEKYF